MLSEQQRQLEASVIRILYNGETIGTGFLVDARTAVTCAHVAAKAGGPGNFVQAGFLADPKVAQQEGLISKQGWSPQNEEDVAFIQFTAVPAAARPVRLAQSHRSPGHDYFAIGYPASLKTEWRSTMDRIVNLEQRLGGETRLLHLRGDEVTFGMSGGPVLDLTLDRVVGMIKGGQEEKHTTLGYAVLAETLQALNPTLRLDDPDELLKASQTRPFRREALPPKGTLPPPGALPPGSHLPLPHNQVFTGRIDDLLALADGLLYSGTPGTAAITQVTSASGLGGIGKTQLAVEFCWRYGRFMEGVHWLQAASPAEIGAQIAQCGAKLGLPGWPEKLPEQVEFTLQAWAASPERLVVLDNLEDPAALREWLPRLAGLRLLVTARRAHWPRELGVMAHVLGTLPRPDSLALLRALAPRLEREPDGDLGKIAEALGDLPLALDLAGRYLDERSRLSPEGYLTELEQAGSALEHTSQVDWSEDSPTGHLPALRATFDLSWQRLAGEGEVETAAREIFLAAGWCAANRKPGNAAKIIANPT